MNSKVKSLLDQREVKRYEVERVMTSEEGGKLMGTFLNRDHIKLLIDHDADVYDKDTGTLLVCFRKNIIPASFCKDAYEALRGVAVPLDNRGIAAGYDEDKIRKLVLKEGAKGFQRTSSDGFRFKLITKEGILSNTSRAIPANSGIVGYFDRGARFPYCRQTSFNQRNLEKFEKAWPIMKRVDEIYEILVPKNYKAQREVADRTSQDFVIQDTAFTTVTVNKNWQTAVHKDSGDFEAGFGNLTVLQAGEYKGGETCFPEWGVAVDVRNFDVLLMDVHQWHGNMPLDPNPDDYENESDVPYERVSLVMYYRKKMIQCGTAQQEIERAKRRKPGDKVYD